MLSTTTTNFKMPFAPIPVTTEDFVTYLTENFGTEVNTKNFKRQTF